MNKTLLENAKLVLLSHSPTDLLTLNKAASDAERTLELPRIVGLNLQEIESRNQLSELIDLTTNARAVVLRVLGRASTIQGFSEFARIAKGRNQALLVLNGNGEPDPEMAAYSNVSPAVLHDVQSYFIAGGVRNAVQLIRYLSDHFLLTTFDYETAQPLPEHGIYIPGRTEAASFQEWRTVNEMDAPTVGITFYRAHWMSGNTDFIDTLADSLAKRNLNVLAVFTSSLKARSAEDISSGAFQYFWQDGSRTIDLLINTTSFAMADINPDGPTLTGALPSVFEALNVPVVQAITSGMTRDSWQQSTRGLTPLDMAMNVLMPEFDGRIVSVPVSFKRDADEQSPNSGYEPLLDRVEHVANFSEKLIRLRTLNNSEKRVAFLFTNTSSQASQIGNAVGLDSPASLVRIIEAMKNAGYRVGDCPSDGTEIVHKLIDRFCYDRDFMSESQCAQAIGRVSASRYRQWFAELPQTLQHGMLQQWGAAPGEAYVHDGELLIAGLEYDNILVALQPPRGYGMDPDAIVHRPDLPPTHHYYAMYKWLRDGWGADAIVHVGKHGTLEWLPGKGVGLSQDCFPDALLSDMPLFYPFIINDPGEGSQAKRRAHAVVVDHLTPVMTTAETYGVLGQLTQLVDEYYQMELLEPSKLPLLQQQIWQLVKESKLDSDIRAIVGSTDHDADDHDHHDDDDHDHDHDHEHEWNSELSEHGVPVSLAKMNSRELDHLIQTIDGYLCELGMAEIRDGLHTFGQAPEGNALIDMLISLTRLPNLDVPSLQAAIALHLGYDCKQLLEQPGKRLDKQPALGAMTTEKALFTNGDVIELIDQTSRALFQALEQKGYAIDAIDDAIRTTLNSSTVGPQVAHVLRFACTTLVPNLAETKNEIKSLLNGLDGKFIPPGPSGAPTRGMAHILPTGKNFYSVDPRALPSQSAWHVGQQLANAVLKRHLKESGRYPDSVSISIWGTSAMRTHGDDVAEILYLLGVRPVWQAENRRLTGVELISLDELKRPRIDVTIRISGFFRDAFGHLIDLLDRAVNLVIGADESIEMNYPRAHYLADLKRHLGEGDSAEEASRKSSFRIFGSKPGSYGAGILPLINEKNWTDERDFAEAYVNWGGYAYGSSAAGVEAKDEFRNRLSKVEIALHNQDNREHDIFDSDDYLQFHGGIIATIFSLTGKRPKHYFGDSHNPASPVVRDLKEEALRVFRSRVVNPKWLSSIQKHGYKGGLELTATVDYLFGYDATSAIMEDWMYEEVAQTYALDEGIQQFLAESNPWALNAISERLLEAAQRKMWSAPEKATLDALNEIYLESEAQLEARGEAPRVAGVAK
jgi:cobaltochelatase CobN